jgi:hypothetical protein
MKLNDLLNAYRAELDSAQPPKLDHLFEEPVVVVTRRSRAPWYAAGGLAAAAALALVFWPKAPDAVIAPASLAEQARIAKAPEVNALGPDASGPDAPEAEAQAIEVVHNSVRARKATQTMLKPQVERTTFVALAEMDMLPEPRVYQVVRVSVDEARLVGLGLSEARPAPGRKIAAQVLLGEDGIARAIRVLGEERE